MFDQPLYGVTQRNIKWCEFELAAKKRQKLLVRRRFPELSIRSGGVELEMKCSLGWRSGYQKAREEAYPVLALETNGRDNGVCYLLDADLLIFPNYQSSFSVSSMSCGSHPVTNLRE